MGCEFPYKGDLFYEPISSAVEDILSPRVDDKVYVRCDSDYDCNPDEMKLVENDSDEKEKKMLLDDYTRKVRDEAIKLLSE